jgi:hypothetical protein
LPARGKTLWETIVGSLFVPGVRGEIFAYLWSPNASGFNAASLVSQRRVPLPNVHRQDMPLRAQIAVISLHRTQESIEALWTAFDFEDGIRSVRVVQAVAASRARTAWVEIKR